MTRKSNTISELCLRNGTASLKNLYPLSKVKTEADKANLATQGYNPGFTVDEWPYALPVEHIFYSEQLFPGTFYYDPDNSSIPIAINLHIYGKERMAIIEDDNEFCEYILNFVESLKSPSIDKVRSYLLAQDDGFRSELLAEYIRRSDPSPELYSLFADYYTVTDYGAGAYELPLLQKVFSGKGEEQKAETAAALADYPDEVTIYRGEAEGSTPYHKAFSWTVDINIAFFFACRHGDHDHARIIRAKIQKVDIKAAFLDCSEKEVIVLPGVPFEISKEKLIGPDSPAVMPPKYIALYVAGREKIKDLYRRKTESQHSSYSLNWSDRPDGSDSSDKASDHNDVHSARVLFLAYSILQAGKIKLTAAELEQLRTAIVYHDIGRCNDHADETHGYRSRKVYERIYTDPAVAFLIQYHCIDDAVSRAQLKSLSITSKNRTWLLYQILKDADALDRVRFGISNLDVNYLRLPISHKLVPLAVAALRGIEL